jgi:hypothetical protein
MKGIFTFFITLDVYNNEVNLRGYFSLFLIMVEVVFLGQLYGLLPVIFHNEIDGNLDLVAHFILLFVYGIGG